MFALNLYLDKIDNCKNNPEKSSKTKIRKNNMDIQYH